MSSSKCYCCHCSLAYQSGVGPLVFGPGVLFCAVVTQLTPEYHLHDWSIKAIAF
jgi:hypothetical protein